MKKKLTLFLLLTLFFSCFVIQNNILAQTNISEVEAKGIGTNKNDALQDALRNAIGQAAGVSLASETKVENFMVVKDAISTNTKGYITSYQVLKETPLASSYEVIVKAKVSLDPMKADAKLLMKQIGGVRFLVMYDNRKINKNETPNYDFAVNKINSYLSERGYRYIEKSRFDELVKESGNIMQDTDTGGALTYVQQLGMKAGAEFIILVSGIKKESRSENFDTRTSTKVIIDIKAFDNCTAEGLGTITLESPWNTTVDTQSGEIKGIEQAITNNGVQRLLNIFTQYIGDWVNNGIPYELRFYQMGTFRDFKDLRTKIKDDPNFGGQINITSFNNLTKLNCTFKNLPDDVAYNILDYSDEIPGFKSKNIDVLLIFGRQINFAPRNVVIPELKNITPSDNKTNNTNTNNQPKNSNINSGAKTNNPGTKTNTGTSKTNTPKTNNTKTNNTKK